MGIVGVLMTYENKSLSDADLANWTKDVFEALSKDTYTNSMLSHAIENCHDLMYNSYYTTLLDLNDWGNGWKSLCVKVIGEIKSLQVQSKLNKTDIDRVKVISKAKATLAKLNRNKTWLKLISE